MPSPHPCHDFVVLQPLFECSTLSKARVRHNFSNSCQMFGLGAAQMWFLKWQLC